MTFEIIFAILLFILSLKILLTTWNIGLNKNEADRAIKRFECNEDISIYQNGNYILGTALLKNKKTGELKFINQAKLSPLALL